MKKTGTIQITEDLTLKDFTWKIKGATYDWENDKASIEVHMWENIHVHSRSFTFDCTEEWSSDRCLSEILKLEPFKGSV